MRRSVFLFLLMLATIRGFAQKDWETISTDELVIIYDKVNTFYQDNETVYFTVQHQSFSDSLEVVPTENMSGYYFKDGNNFCLDILGIETAQIKDDKFTVVTERKEIIVADAEKMLEISPLERQKGMDHFIKKISMRHEQNYSELMIQYHFGVTYSSIYLKIYDTGFVGDITLYFSEKVNWIDENDVERSTQPKMEITYELHPEMIEKAKQKLKSSTYVMNLNKESCTPSLKYKRYRVTDLRIKKHKN